MNIDILWSVCNIIIKTGDIRTLCTLQQCCMEMNNYIAQYNMTTYRFRNAKKALASLHDIRAVLICANEKMPGTTFDDVSSALQSFSDMVYEVPSSRLSPVIDEYYEPFKSIKNEVDSLIRNTTNQSEKQHLICYRNQVFLSKLKDIKYVEQAKDATVVFNNFMKGITFFDNQLPYESRSPVYHRPGSCTKRNEPNQVCSQGNGSNLSHSQHIETCFVERLVYDAIWNEMYLTQQNKEHMERLENTRQAYLSCFPNQSLQVEVEFNLPTLNNNNASAKLINVKIPVKLAISFYAHNGTLLKKEIHVKRYDNVMKAYQYPVVCQKTENGQRYIKSSFFEADLNHDWVVFGGGTKKNRRK